VNCIVARGDEAFSQSAMPLPPTLRPVRARALAAAALALGIVAAAAAAGTDEAGVLEPCAGAQELQAAVEQLNAMRRQRAACAVAGASMQRLAWEERLAESATEQARDLALRDRLSHVDSRNRGLGARLRSVGYAAAGAGENLAAGQTEIGDALQAWLASPSHCANLMQPEYRDVGLACVQRRGSRYERFWVAHFGVPAAPLSPLARR
jgi:uncharacterized protein YkwD